MNKKMICKNCAHFYEKELPPQERLEMAASKKADKSTPGECRVFPPQVVITPGPQGVALGAFFPAVMSDCVCGQFEDSIED